MTGETTLYDCMGNFLNGVLAVLTALFLALPGTALAAAVNEASPQGSEAGTISPWAEERLNNGSVSENMNGQAIPSDNRSEDEGVYINGTYVGPTTTMLLIAVGTGLVVGLATYIILTVKDRGRRKKISTLLDELDNGQ